MLTFRMTGQTEIAKAVKGVAAAVHRKHALRAVVTATYPLVQAMKGYLKSHNLKGTGALLDSLGTGLTQNKRGLYTGIRVGARGAFMRNGERPARYVHLVELGHALATGGMVPPRPFVRPAWARTQARVKSKLTALLGAAIDGEFGKKAKAAIRKAARAAR